MVVLVVPLGSVIGVLMGQFSYTACQTAGPYSAVPGWKIKQVMPSQPETDVPKGAVEAAVRPFGGFRPPAVPALATQVEIDQLPRCLRLDVLEGPYRSVAHLAAAGRDHSGRDAFFAHGLLVALTSGSLPLPAGGQATSWGVVRPADLWAADGWLTPYRADAIEAAEVGPVPQTTDASPLNPERREDFVDLHPGQRAFVLAAAERAITIGPPLVIVGLPVEAAMWTSLITHLLSPTAGWSVAFSTYESGPGSDLLRPGGPQVIGIGSEGAADWDRMTADQAIVHNPSRSAVREPAGFRLPDGSLLAVGRWAELAERVCTAGLENDVRRAIDKFGGDVGDALDSWPLIALPAAVLALPGSQLDEHRDVAALAAQVVIERFPFDAQLDPELLWPLVDAVFRFSPNSIDTSARLLHTLDRGQDTSSALIDRLLVGYLEALLRSPDRFDRDQAPWIPNKLQLSRSATDEFLFLLPESIIPVATTGTSISKARVLLTLASLAERWGWLDAHQPLLHRLLGDPSRTWVVQQILGGGAQQASLPAIPRWLWDDVLVDELQNLLPAYPPGSVLADPVLRSIVDGAAGPLPSSYVPGETLRDISLVDGERAVAVLLAPATEGQPVITSAQDEVLRVAAFLRSVATAHGAASVAPDRLFAELRRWFPGGQPRAAVLIDLLEQLRGTVPVGSLRAFAMDVLASLAPDTSTAAVSRTLIGAGVRQNDLRNTIAEWHTQFGQQVPATSREVNLPSAPLARPDFPETRLLDVLAAGRLPPALLEAGHRRLARWVLVLAAEMLELPGNSIVTEQSWWLRQAAIEPLAGKLEPGYSGAARQLVADHQRAAPGWSLAADVLAAEWIVRSRLAELGIGTDPASTFFAEPADRGPWATGVQALVRPEARTRQDLSDWVRRVGRSAEAAASVLKSSNPAADRGHSLIDTAVDTASRLVASTGLRGRVRRIPVRRDDP